MSIRLNLGSHNKDIGEDYINADALYLDNVDVLTNLARPPFTFVIKEDHKFDREIWGLEEDHYLGKMAFKIEDDFVDEVNMVEVLEHISFRLTYPVLKEIYRILKVGGVIKIQVPDCGSAMDAYVNGKVCACVPHKANVDGEFIADKGCPDCKGNGIMDWERWKFSFTGAQKHEFDAHLAIFTKEMMRQELTKVGFTDIKFTDNPVKIKVQAIK